MVSIRDIEAASLIKKTAEELKKIQKMPEWARFVKTGAGRERMPEDPDWWYVRSASILRRIYVDGPVGVNRLRDYYSSRKRRGHKPAHRRKGSGKVIRTIVQDLDRLGLIKNTNKPKKGRIISSKGEKFLNEIAKKMI
jgi:small subunit ribosomal protein S19e